VTWVRLDDGFAEHPKMEAAGPLGLALHVAALCYCARHLTDGFVPAGKVPRLLDLPAWRKVAGTLVDAGAWDEVDGGYQLHDYLHYQPSRAEVEADRAKARDRMRRRRSGGSSGEQPQNFGSGSVAPSRPVPSPSTNPLHYSRVQGLAAVKADQKCVDCFGKGWVIPVDSDTARRCDCVTEAAS
jgi:hypothetical protein